jgi:uncharacterized protein YegL
MTRIVGTKKQLKFAKLPKGGTPFFGQAFFKVQNVISHRIFMISTNGFQFLAPLDVLF